MKTMKARVAERGQVDQVSKVVGILGKKINTDAVMAELRGRRVVPRSKSTLKQ